MDVHVGDGVARDVSRVRRGAGRDGHGRWASAGLWTEDGSRARAGAEAVWAVGDCACGGDGTVWVLSGLKGGRNRRRKRAKSWGDHRWERVYFSTKGVSLEA